MAVAGWAFRANDRTGEADACRTFERPIDHVAIVFEFNLRELLRKTVDFAPGQHRRLGRHRDVHDVVHRAALVLDKDRKWSTDIRRTKASRWPARLAPAAPAMLPARLRGQFRTRPRSSECCDSKMAGADTRRHPPASSILHC